VIAESAAMATETELKLFAPPRVLQQAARLPWLKKLANGPISRSKLVSVYFDTPKFKLREHGLTLRIRKAGRRRLQTIKSAANGKAASRNEWEEEISGDKPKLKRAKQTALAPLASRKLKKSLRPVFETDVQRIIMPLRFRSSEVELALDRGRISTGDRHATVSEIELELKRGRRADLTRLAERLASALPLAYAARAKADRGYALIADEEEKRPVGAATVILPRTASTADAFSVIGSSCLNHLAANEEAVRRGVAEGVHQMRVGLRRLRAAISLFKDMVRNAETEGIKSELKWLTAQLGPARDLDVFVAESVAPLRRDNPDKPEVKLLETEIREKRDRGFDRAKAAVESERYRKAILTTALWLIDGRWSKNKGALIIAQRKQPAVKFAQDVLRRRTRKILKQSRKLDELDAGARHKLRIAVKKLRYATDFFASLFDKPKAGKARGRFAKDLKALQSALGKLNDMAVHQKLARQYVHTGARLKQRPQKAFAAGMLTGREQFRARAHIESARAAGKRLARAKPFWR
jgi:inorganic triphosphatase YgiF